MDGSMTSVVESAFFFECDGDYLPGIISAPEVSADLGVLIVVGGPQYRTGSHRQFVLLAREIASAGLPCMRFDFRGSGDATGERRTFENVDRDISAAIDAFVARQSGLRKVVLWGLCDAASAACFVAPNEPRVAGLILLNPWVKTLEGQSRTLLRHYYLERLLSVSFWKKLLSGDVAIKNSLSGLGSTVTSARGSRALDNSTLPVRMARSLARAQKPVWVVLSGRDYVAREFEQALESVHWLGVIDKTRILRVDGADHTFSSARWRDEVARMSVQIVRSMIECNSL